MQLTTKAQQTFNVLEELKRIYDDKIMHGAEGLEGQERASYLYECKHVQSCINIVQNRMYDSFAQEEIDDFYLEQHTNEERLEYTMKSMITSYFPVGHDGVYLKFIELFIDGFQDAFNFMEAENAGQKAREEGTTTFRKAYTIYTLETLIDMCIARINYSDAQCEQLIYNATALKLFTEILNEIA